MNRRRLRLGFGLIAGLLLLVLIAVTVATAWRTGQQEQRNQALIAAVKSNDASSALALLEQGADANAQDVPHQPISLWTLIFSRIQGRSPAQVWGTPVLLLALGCEEKGTSFSFHHTDNLPLIRALVAHGARIDEQTPYGGWCALSIAAWSNQPDVTEFLIEHHANLNLKNREGQTVLALAPRQAGKKGMDWSKMKVFMMLKRAGAQQ